MYKIKKITTYNKTVEDYYEVVDEYGNMYTEVNLSCSTRLELKRKVKMIAEDLGIIRKSHDGLNKR